MRSQRLASIILFALIGLSAGCAPVPRWSAPSRSTVGRVTVLSDDGPHLTRRVAHEARDFLTRMEDWIGAPAGVGEFEVYLFAGYSDFQRTMRAKGEGITYFGIGSPVVALPVWPLEMKGRRGPFVRAVLEAVGADWVHRLRHELVHVYFRAADGLDRDWLWEGVADYFSHAGASRGMKAQRFLTLRRAYEEERLRPLEELRRVSINAGRSDAQLLYAEAWSVVYTAMNLCGSEVRARFTRYLRGGAKGPVLAAIGLSDQELDRRRFAFIRDYRCFIEAAGAGETKLRDGDCLVGVNRKTVTAIRNRGELGSALNFLLRPLCPAGRNVGAKSINCLVERGRQLRLIQMSPAAFGSVPWRLTARPAAPSPKKESRPRAILVSPRRRR